MNKDDIIRAGALAHQVRMYGATLIKPGASYMDIITLVTQKIKSFGAIPAFPAQMALNDVAAHFLCDPGKDIILSNELVSLDVGVCVNGAIGDCAITVDLSGKYQALIDAAQAGLDAATNIIAVGVTLGDIGAAIDNAISQRGFVSVKNLSGHGLGENQIHTSPTIPNYDNKSSVKLKPGMHFAVEPFATTGVGLIYDAGNATIFSLLHKKSVRSPTARSVMAIIDSFHGLPFSIHDLLRDDLPLFKVKFALHELIKLGIIQDHAPLVEESGGFVAQAEHTFFIDEDGTVILTTK